MSKVDSTVGILALVVSAVGLVCKPATGAIKRYLLRRCLNEHFSSFGEELFGEIIGFTKKSPIPKMDEDPGWNAIYAESRIAKIKKDFIKKLNPKNEKEQQAIASAVDLCGLAMSERATELRLSIRCGAIPSAEHQKKAWEVFEQEAELFKTKLYKDIIFNKNSIE